MYWSALVYQLQLTLPMDKGADTNAATNGSA